MTSHHDLSTVRVFWGGTEIKGAADADLSCASFGQPFKISTPDGALVIDDHVEVCEPEPLVFLLRGFHRNYVVPLKPEATEAAAAMRAICRATEPDDVALLTHIRALPARPLEVSQ